MKDLLIATLEPLGYPIIQQGSLAPEEEYPESFFTFWNNSADGNEFYDNEEHSYIWSFDLNFYSTDPALVNQMLLEAKALLVYNKFTVTGKGHDVMSDEKTHTGRGITVYKIEK
ncbi:hypothetical protein [Priestia megaterium]|uniref:hypothetical protein n=1 Tax=Priestia megaterium TaxID=1404 RepID=UPI002E1BEEA6|nr:hypothetical protein [Priestia megaterium]